MIDNADTVISIADGIDLIPIDATEVLVQFGSRSYPSELLRDSALSGALGQLVGILLRGPARIGDVVSQFDERTAPEAHSLLCDLLERGVLTDVRSSAVEQYLRYTFTGESDLSTCTVGIIGAGPLGGRIACGLLDHGLQQVGVLDDRPVDDLWRGLAPGGEPAAGSTGPAAKALSERLLGTTTGTLDAFEGDLDLAGIEAIASGSDLLVVALERPSLRLTHLVNRVCVRERKPWMLVTLDGSFGLIGPLFVPPHTACYACYRTLADAATPHREIARKYRQHLLQSNGQGFSVGLPAYVDVLAGYALLAIVRHLLNAKSFAVGRVLVCNFERMLLDVEDVLKLPRCPVCGTDKSIPRQPFPPEVVMATAASPTG